MVEFTKYKCDHCKKELKRKSAMVNHEATCYKNPANKSCVTCGFSTFTKLPGTVDNGAVIIVNCKYKESGTELRANHVLNCSIHRLKITSMELYEWEINGVSVSIEQEAEEEVPQLNPMDINW